VEHNQLNKIHVTYNISKSVLDEFHQVKGAYVKSALVEFWIKQFLKKEQGFIP